MVLTFEDKRNFLARIFSARVPGSCLSGNGILLGPGIFTDTLRERLIFARAFSDKGTVPTSKETVFFARSVYYKLMAPICSGKVSLGEYV